MITPSLLPAGVAALGLALLDGRIAPALWLSLRVGLGIAMWLVLWQAGGAWIAASGRLSGLTADAGHALALNAGLGLIAWSVGLGFRHVLPTLAPDRSESLPLFGCGGPG